MSRAALGLLVLWVACLPLVLASCSMDEARLYSVAPILAVLGLVVLTRLIGAVLRLLRL